MKIGYGARVAGSVFLSVMFLSFGGCGYKNDPVPPESVVPKAVEDLRYVIDESGVTLTWSYPVKTIKGSEIKDISAFDIYRAVVPLDDYCENCPIPFGEPVEIPGGVTSMEGKRRGAEYKTSLLRSGHKYFFKLRSKTSWWASSADSNVVSFVWHIPVKAPEGLNAVPADTRITLTWSPVTELVNGDAAEGKVSYQVMRSQGGKEFELVSGLVGATRFVDTRVINGKKYFYKVQSQLDYKGNEVAGGVSDIVTVSPIDQTPPPIPSGVKAVQAGSDIKVFWNQVSDPEVAAYKVYRRTADQKKAEFIAEVKVPYTLFVDKNVPENQRVYYSVTAVDGANPPNESDTSREATVR